MCNKVVHFFIPFLLKLKRDNKVELFLGMISYNKNQPRNSETLFPNTNLSSPMISDQYNLITLLEM